MKNQLTISSFFFASFLTIGSERKMSFLLFGFAQSFQGVFNSMSPAGETFSLYLRVYP